MALDVQIRPDDTLSGTSQVTLLDETGIYSPVNTGGWGTPNDNRSAVNLDDDNYPFDINITFPYQTAVGKTINDVGNSYGFLVSYSRIDLSPTAIYGSDTVIEDGVWLFEFSFYVGTTQYTRSVYWLNTKNLECCMSKYQAEIANCQCSDKREKFAEIEYYYNGAVWAYGCGKKEDAEAMLKKASALCNKTGCGC